MASEWYQALGSGQATLFASSDSFSVSLATVHANSRPILTGVLNKLKPLTSLHAV